MAYGHVADEVVQNGWIKNLRHKPHAVMFEKFPVMAGDNARAFLTAMLEGVKTVIGKFSGIRMPENAEHATIMFGIVLLLHRPRRCIVAKTNPARKPEEHSAF